MIIHIPHSSTVFPPGVRGQFFVDEDTLQGELLRSTDWFTDELFDSSGCETLVFPISRIVVDPERFESDDREPMAKVGRGVIYHAQTTGEAMRRSLTPVEREHLLQTYYRPHHQRLTERVEAERDRDGSVLIVDAHSFPLSPWTIEPDKTGQRPDFCLGASDYHTPDELIRVTRAFLNERGYSVAINTPYAGTMIPLTYLEQDRRVGGVMIEINRRLYMDEQKGAKNSDFQRVKSVVGGLLEVMDGAWKECRR